VFVYEMKRAEYTGNDFEIMPLNSPGGSTLQWGVERGVQCLSPFVFNVS